MSIKIPYIDPVALNIGSINIKWYSILFLLGFIISTFVTSKDLKKSNHFFEDCLFYTTLYCIFFARIFYVVFYGASFFIHNPLKILFIWNGGLSFHGGMLGVIVAIYHLSVKYNINFFKISDSAACIVPVALFLGRIANFINGELRGIKTSVSWGIVYYNEYFARHPSQLYEAFFEGIILFLILNYIKYKYKNMICEGVISYLFCFLYAFFRFVCEFFREPDSHIGYLIGSITMGQLFSILLFCIGIVVCYLSHSKNIKQSNNSKNSV